MPVRAVVGDPLPHAPAFWISYLAGVSIWLDTLGEHQRQLLGQLVKERSSFVGRDYLEELGQDREAWDCLWWEQVD